MVFDLWSGGLTSWSGEEREDGCNGGGGGARNRGGQR